MWNWVAKLQELSASGRPFAIVTVTRCSGSTPRETGAKMLVLADGPFFGTIGGGQLEKQAIEDAQRCIREGSSQTLHFPLHASVGQCCGGVVELLVEIMNQGPLFYIFGAGHVGQALARTLVDTPFQVTLIDERSEWANSPLIPASVNRFCGNPRVFIEQALWDSGRTFVAIMTHEHDLDRELLQQILAKKTHYLGLIGSETKWQSFQNRLRAAGVDDGALRKVHCPIGIPVGGKAPQEVAISIAAEVLKTHYEK